MSIDKLLQQYKTEAELRSFAEASYKSLLQLQKRNQELNNEVEHLKSLVTGAVPIINKNNESELEVSSDEEEIAKIELRKLKELSYKQVLTLEEAKRVEIYSKILTSRMSKGETDNSRDVTGLNSDTLLAIAESTEEKKVN